MGSVAPGGAVRGVVYLASVRAVVYLASVCEVGVPVPVLANLVCGTLRSDRTELTGE